MSLASQENSPHLIETDDSSPWSQQRAGYFYSNIHKANPLFYTAVS
jgi:hypothetical protein